MCIRDRGTVSSNLPRSGALLAFFGFFLACDHSSGGGPTGTGTVDSTGHDSLGKVAIDSTMPGDRARLDALCLETINSWRATLSLKALAAWTDSATCFSRQAALDAKSGKAHGNFGMCKESAQNTCPGWFADAAVGGPQGAMERCIESMWKEGPGEDFSKHGHYINMTNAKYSKVGCGFHITEGSVWINMDFK